MGLAGHNECLIEIDSHHRAVLGDICERADDRSPRVSLGTVRLMADDRMSLTAV